MYSPKPRSRSRVQVHKRIRKNLRGTIDRPRLAVFRSLRNIYTQVIDDSTGRTLVSASSVERDGPVQKGGTVDAATEIGKLIAQRASKAGIRQVVFDRGGHRFHGRVKALAEAAREAGLEF